MNLELEDEEDNDGFDKMSNLKMFNISCANGITQNITHLRTISGTVLSDRRFPERPPSTAQPMRYDGWNPVPWYEQRGYNITTMPLAPENISSMGRGLVRMSGTIVRPEEVGIVFVVLLLWVAAITLFINRWGKIRLMEPYQPHFEAGDVTPPPTVMPSATGTARPSICHLTSIDRRPSVMVVQCMDESLTNKKRKSSNPYHCSSNLSIHRLENGKNSNRSNHIPGFRHCHLGYSQAPERRASFVNIFQHRNTAFNVYHNNSLGPSLANRRKSEINPVMFRNSNEKFPVLLQNSNEKFPFLIRGSNERLTTSVPPKIFNSRRTSLQIPNLDISNFSVQKSPFHSLLSLEDRDCLIGRKKNPLLEKPSNSKSSPNSSKLLAKVSRDRPLISISTNCAENNSFNCSQENQICSFEEVDETENDSQVKFKHGASVAIPLPKFSYTTPTPEIERNTPDFQKLNLEHSKPAKGDKNNPSKDAKSQNVAKSDDAKPAKKEITSLNVAKSRSVVARRKIGVVTIHEHEPKEAEVIFQIPVNVKDSDNPLSAPCATKSSYETKSKLESDV